MYCTFYSWWCEHTLLRIWTAVLKMIIVQPIQIVRIIIGWLDYTLFCDFQVFLNCVKFALLPQAGFRDSNWKFRPDKSFQIFLRNIP